MTRPALRSLRTAALASALFLSAGRQVARADDLGIVGASAIDVQSLTRSLSLLNEGPREVGADSSRSDALASRLAKELSNAGWEAVLPSGSMVQPHPVSHGARPSGAIGFRDLERGYSWGQDWNPFGGSATARALMPLAFAGYGITAPELNYDDYAALDVKEHVVVLFFGEPGADDARSPFDGLLTTGYSLVQSKIENAGLHGASGVLLTRPPLMRNCPAGLEKTSQEALFVDLGLPVAELSLAAAGDLMKNAGSGERRGKALDLTAVQSVLDRGEPAGERFPVSKVELLTALSRIPVSAYNVIARLPGSGEGTVRVFAAYDTPVLAADDRATSKQEGPNLLAAAALLEAARVLPRVPREKTIEIAFVEGSRVGGARAAAHVMRDQPSAVLTLERFEAAAGGRADAVGESPALRSRLDDAVRNLAAGGAEASALKLAVEERPVLGALGLSLAEARGSRLQLTGGSTERGTDVDGVAGPNPAVVALARYTLGVVEALAR